MKKIFTSIPNLLLSIVICFVLSSCSSTGVKMNESSPWKTIQFEDQANALDVDFIDDNHGFIVGSNRLIMESTDGGDQIFQEMLMVLHCTLQIIMRLIVILECIFV